jgi:hypothetical protein
VHAEPPRLSYIKPAASEERRTQAEIQAENLRHGVSEQAETTRTGIKTASDERQNALSELTPESPPAVPEPAAG